MTRLALLATLMVPGLALAQDPPAADAPEAPTEEEAAPAGPTTYTLSPTAGRLYVLVRYKRGTIGAGLAHDHVVAATGWTGSAVWDADDVSACDVRFDLPVSGLVVDPGDAREWEGLEGETSDGDKETIQENLRGRHQLQMSSFPGISYRSSSCAAGADGKTNVTGTLTIHGVGHQVTVPMAVTADGESFRASGEFSANHGDFGMDPYSAAFGAVKNDEALKFVISVSGNPG